MADDCIFCKIVAGELPAEVVDQDDHTVSFMDINPWTRGHALVIPRNHSRNLYEIDEEDLAHVAAAAKRLALRMRERLGCDGINLLNSSETAAWQTVFHFHMHVIPRYEDDPLRLPGAPQQVDPDGAAQARGGAAVRVALALTIALAAAGVAFAQDGTKAVPDGDDSRSAADISSVRAVHDRANDRLAHIIRFHAADRAEHARERGRRARPARERLREHLDTADAVGGVAQFRGVRDAGPRRARPARRASASSVHVAARASAGPLPPSSRPGAGWSCASTRI